MIFYGTEKPQNLGVKKTKVYPRCQQNRANKKMEGTNVDYLQKSPGRARATLPFTIARTLLAVYKPEPAAGPHFWAVRA